MNPYESPQESEPIIRAELVRKTRHPVLAAILLAASVPLLVGLLVLLAASVTDNPGANGMLLVIGMAFLLPVLCCIHELVQFRRGR